MWVGSCTIGFDMGYLRSTGRFACSTVWLLGVGSVYHRC